LPKIVNQQKSLEMPVPKIANRTNQSIVKP
jgi:hypothetical protein